MIGLELTKGLVLGGMFAITGFFCCLPAWIISCVRTRRLESGPRAGIFRSSISFLNCFACGVFLGTLFLDLQPEVIESFKLNLNRLGIQTEYPLAQFCTVFGFLLVLIVERIVVSCKSAPTNIFHNHKHGSSASGSRPNSLQSNPDLHVERERLQRYALPNPYHPESTQEPSSSESTRGDFRTRRPSEVSLPDQGDDDVEIMSSVESSRCSSPTGDAPGSGNNRGPSRHEPALRAVKSKSHQLTHTARSFILLVALSLHSIFEGLAVGLQDSRRKVLEIFVALLIHKCVVAFSVGMNLMQSRMAFRHVIMCAMIFAAASPLGIAIAMGMDNVSQDPGAGLASAVLQAFACGTFLFITFLEVLPHEMLKGSEGEAPGTTLLKILCMVLGFSVMAGLMFMDNA
ncbi:putative Zinc transporter ZIP1 [Hypsibius exemplaris]|uniref:Zinc transporter ZIP1 n=1 Tax=Hypsibius exemplaris TaxID=2072580 RepID=A0A1W0WDK6_HYPEX|nr:putative Zinc transporter ZIP1 [Hypsibius exemplaris]